MAELPPRVRRIVTTLEQGRSLVLSDAPIEPIAPPAGSHETQFSPLWGTLDCPSEAPSRTDGVATLTSLVNAKGSTFRIVDTGPHSSSPMHRTESVDYILVLLGELEMELEGGKLVFVKAGDIVVQQGAMHQWHNRTDQWARFAAIMLGATITGAPASEEGLIR